jgi:hypothetical protein
MTAWADQVSYGAAKQWMTQLQRTSGEPPVCSELDP